MKLRASQIKGCSFCVDMHAKVARAIGEEEEHLHLVVVWEAACYSDRERVALAWTDAKWGGRRRPDKDGCTTLTNRPQQTGGSAAPDRAPIAPPALLQITTGPKGRP